MRRLLAVLAMAGTGAAVGAHAQHVMERVSIATDGGQANDNCDWPVISADGRCVTFSSVASTLVAGDANGVRDIFVHDRETGATERVSVSTSGAEADGESEWPRLSGDGRYVTFYSAATNLVSGDTNGQRDIFVHDRQTGETTLVSVSSAGVQGNDRSQYPAITPDGRYVAFDSLATNLVSGDTNGQDDVFVHDRQTGETVRVSVDSAGNEGNGSSSDPALSVDGRYVAFQSSAGNLVPDDTNFGYDVFVHDRQTGSTERVSVASDGSQATGTDGGYYPCLSASGRYVGFHGPASNLVPDDTNGAWDIFVHDRETGETERVSLDSAGQQGNGNSYNASLSADGRYVAFRSASTNLVSGDTNACADVFIHDRQTGQTTRVSCSSAGVEGDGASTFLSLAMNAPYYIAFRSLATNLVAGDTNGMADVFVAFEQPLAVRWPR